MNDSTPVLAFNFGTATLKFGLFGPDGSAPIIGGTVESPSNGEAGILAVRRALEQHPEPNAIAHRVVHGGPRQSEPALIDNKVERKIERLIPLAPLHNRVALDAISAARGLWPGVPRWLSSTPHFMRACPLAPHGTPFLPSGSRLA